MGYIADTCKGTGSRVRRDIVDETCCGYEWEKSIVPCPGCPDCEEDE